MSVLVRIRSSNGPAYLVQQSLIAKSEKIKSLIDELGPGSAENHPEVYIPLKAETLRLVFTWMHRHKDDTGQVDRRESDGRGDGTETEQWDLEFLAEIQEEYLLDVFWAADFLGVTELANLMANAAAGLIDRKTPDDLRQTFNTKQDFKKEEKDKIMQENQWLENH